MKMNAIKKIDKQGRIVLPKKMMEIFKINTNDECVIEFDSKTKKITITKIKDFVNE